MSSRVWLVTGCSTGLGRSLAETILKKGDRLVATARDTSSLAGLSSEHGEDRLLRLPLDVTKQKEIDEAFQKAIDHFGRIDVVVNNAGFGLIGEFESVTDELAQRLLDVNLWGVVRVSRAALRVFREVNKSPIGGRLIQISSAGGFVGLAGLPYYIASKHAIEGLTESMSKELNPEWNIKITIVQPGGLRTDFASRSALISPSHPAYADAPAVAAIRALANRSPEVQQQLNALVADPYPAAEAIHFIGGVDNPPLRLPLGADAVGLIKNKLEQVQSDLNTWLSLSLSTSDNSEGGALASLQKAGIKFN